VVEHFRPIFVVLPPYHPFVLFTHVLLKMLPTLRTNVLDHGNSLMLGLPYVRFFLDMSKILVAKYASGRNVKKCFNVWDFGIMPFMKSNCNVFTVRITKC